MVSAQVEGFLYFSKDFRLPLVAYQRCESLLVVVLFILSTTKREQRRR
nr:MAG TPA: hypothetical protein [Caudoviricetes sp.]